MLKKSKDKKNQLVHLRDGEVVLYRRNRSGYWQTRYKLGAGKWHRASTKTANLHDAKRNAGELYDRARFLRAEGLVAVSRRFSAVAKLAISAMQKALDVGGGKVVYKHYIAVIKHYLIPFFGKRNVNAIDHVTMQEFAVWRNKKIGHEPTASTINTHNAALSRVFDEAISRQYMTNTQRPVLVNKGKKSKRRPDFSLQEYRQLLHGMRKWIKGGRTEKSKQMRELLRDYVLVLANTGMRHGTESYGLTWKRVRFYEDRGKRYLAMSVSGKTGDRELIARHSCVAYLKRIHQRCIDIKDVTFEELLKKGVDKKVFRLNDGTFSNNLNKVFARMLEDLELLVDRRTGQKRTLYSLRHTYATLAALQRNISYEKLARQMGTSVQMIDKHYSHLTPLMIASELAGKDHEAAKAEKRRALEALQVASGEVMDGNNEEKEKIRKDKK